MAYSDRGPAGRWRTHQRSLWDEADGAAIVLGSLQVLVGRAGHDPHRRRVRHEAVRLHAAQQPPQIARVLPNPATLISFATLQFQQVHNNADQCPFS